MRKIHESAKRGIRLLLARQAFGALLAFAASVVLARRLNPVDFGLFGIGVFIVNALAMLGDFGVKAVLIQRARELSDTELRTSFILRQVLGAVTMVLLWVVAPLLVQFYPKAPSELVWLVRIQAVDLLLLPWRATSELLLERRLRYQRLALVETVGSLTFQTTAVALALLGWGVWSFIWASLGSHVLRTALLFGAAPWRVGFTLDRQAAREMLRLGLPVQVGRLVSQAPAWVTPTVVAGLIGPDAVGLLLWASGNGRKPLVLLENAVRVSLPHFSRLQHDAREVERTLSRYVFAFLLVCGLWSAVLAIAGEDLVRFIYTERWLPAVPALGLYAAVGMLVSVRLIATAALVGVGHAGVTARIALVTTLLAVAASVALVFRVGLLGVPTGHLLGLAVAVPWLLSALGQGALVRVLRPAAPVLPVVGLALAAGAVALHAPVGPALRGLITAGVMTAVYGAAAWWLGPAWLRASVRAELGVHGRVLRALRYL